LLLSVRRNPGQLDGVRRKRYRCRRLLAQLEPLSTSVGAYAFVVVVGLVWGSFANVCISRWPPSEAHPHGRSVVKPGSHCFACGKPIRWYDNVPLLSYLWLRGRCRDCKATFSARYLLVEAITGALFAAAWWFTIEGYVLFDTFGVRLERFAIYAGFCFVMVVITFIDLDHKLILNKLTIPSIVIFYGLGLLLPERRWFDGLLGIVVGYGFPWLVGEIYYRIRKREGLGLGDGMLLAVVGALLGWQGVFVSLFGGSVLGSVMGIAVIGIRRRGSRDDTPDEPAPSSSSEAPTPPVDPASPEDDEAEVDTSFGATELPFGPFLVMAALFYLFAEQWLHLHFRFSVG
jgi:leader peptidase (prepilin peptidase) / N-methyltransferase